MAETSDQENTTIANQEPMKDAHGDDHKDMDDIDTDDLLDEAELSLKSTHWTASKTTTTSSRRKGKAASTTSRRRKATKSTEDMDIDESESETGSSNNKRSSRKKAKGKQKVKPCVHVHGIDSNMMFAQPKVVAFDPEYTKKLTQEYPDTYWKFHADAGYQMIDKVNDEATLEALPFNVSDQGMCKIQCIDLGFTQGFITQLLLLA